MSELFREQLMSTRQVENKWTFECSLNAITVTPGMLMPLLLLKREEKLRVNELARLAYVSTQAAGRTLRLMEIAGVISFTPDKYDKRAKTASITNVGLDALTILDELITD